MVVVLAGVGVLEATSLGVRPVPTGLGLPRVAVGGGGGLVRGSRGASSRPGGEIIDPA